MTLKTYMEEEGGKKYHLLAQANQGDPNGEVVEFSKKVNLFDKMLNSNAFYIGDSLVEAFKKINNFCIGFNRISY